LILDATILRSVPLSSAIGRLRDLLRSLSPRSGSVLREDSLRAPGIIERLKRR
jgi:hypothetical protein